MTRVVICCSEMEIDLWWSCRCLVSPVGLHSCQHRATRRRFHYAWSQKYGCQVAAVKWKKKGVTLVLTDASNQVVLGSISWQNQQSSSCLCSFISSKHLLKQPWWILPASQSSFNWPIYTFNASMSLFCKLKSSSNIWHKKKINLLLPVGRNEEVRLCQYLLWHPLKSC